MRLPRLVPILVLVCAATGCGSDSPTTPTTPSTVQVAGVWRGTVRTDAVSGGECIAPLLQSTVGGSDAISVSLTQAGANLTAAVTTISDGGVINYTGTAGSSSIQLSWTTCTSCNVLGIRCSASASRDLRLVNSTISGTVTGNTIAGTLAETYNVVSSTTGVSVSTVTRNGSFTVTRQ